jgi:imidazolonepropionase-like amidohydrolase
VLGDVVSYVSRQQAFDRLGIYPAPVYDAMRGPEAIAAIEAFVDPAVVRKHLPTLRANARRVYDSGANVTFGSDGGTFSQALGITSHLELAAHEPAGLRPHDLLRGATLGAARMLGRAYERGSLAPGKLADLVLLNANPLVSTANLHFVDQVAKGGRLFRAADLLG